MVKPAWGTKRTCQSCGAHFYDMHKSPIGCPKCGAILHAKKPGSRQKVLLAVLAVGVVLAATYFAIG